MICMSNIVFVLEYFKQSEKELETYQNFQSLFPIYVGLC